MPLTPQRRVPNFYQNVGPSTVRDNRDAEVDEMIRNHRLQRDRNMMTESQRRMVMAPQVAPNTTLPQRRMPPAAPNGQLFIPSPGTDGSVDSARYREGRVLGGYADGTKYPGGGSVDVFRTPSGGLGLRGSGIQSTPTADMMAKRAAAAEAAQDYKTRLKDMRALRAYRRNPQLADAPAVIEALARNKTRGQMPGVMFDGRGTVLTPDGRRFPHMPDKPVGGIPIRERSTGNPLGVRPSVVTGVPNAVGGVPTGEESNLIPPSPSDGGYWNGWWNAALPTLINLGVGALASRPLWQRGMVKAPQPISASQPTLSQAQAETPNPQVSRVVPYYGDTQGRVTSPATQGIARDIEEQLRVTPRQAFSVPNDPQSMQQFFDDAYGIETPRQYPLMSNRPSVMPDTPQYPTPRVTPEGFPPRTTPLGPVVADPGPPRPQFPPRTNPLGISGELMPEGSIVPPVIDGERAGQPRGLPAPRYGQLSKTAFDGTLGDQRVFIPPAPATEGQFVPRTNNLPRVEYPAVSGGTMPPIERLPNQPAMSGQQRIPLLTSGSDFNLPAYPQQYRFPVMPQNTDIISRSNGFGTEITQPPPPSGQPQNRAAPFGGMTPAEQAAFERSILQPINTPEYATTESLAAKALSPGATQADIKAFADRVEANRLTGASQSRSMIDPVTDVYGIGNSVEDMQQTGEWGGARKGTGRTLQTLTPKQLDAAAAIAPPDQAARLSAASRLAKENGIKKVPVTPEITAAHKKRLEFDNAQRTPQQVQKPILDARAAQDYSGVSPKPVVKTYDQMTLTEKIEAAGESLTKSNVKSKEALARALNVPVNDITTAQFNKAQSMVTRGKGTPKLPSANMLPKPARASIRGVNGVVDAWQLLSDPLFEYFFPEKVKREREQSYEMFMRGVGPDRSMYYGT